MADLLARDVLDLDTPIRRRVEELLAAQAARDILKGPGEIRIPEGEPPDNWLYNTLADPKLNEGLENIGRNLVGEGTGSFTKDILAGALGGGAGVATEAMGGQSGAIDWIPGGGITKAVLLGLPATVGKYTGKVAARLTNPIARRASQRYGDEAAEQLDKFIEKHPNLKDMNSAEVNDVMESGALGQKYILDIPATYPLKDFEGPVYGSFTIEGKHYNARDAIEKVANLYPEGGYYEFLKELDDEARSLLERGDIAGALRVSGVRDQLAEPGHLKHIVSDPFGKIANTPEKIRERLVTAKDALPTAELISDINVIPENPVTPGTAERIGEYFHIQRDPISNWRDVVYMDDNGARILAEQKAEQEALKAAALVRKEAAEEAKAAAAYEARLKEYRKNPKKSLKTARSAAPKQVRDQGDKAINEWYYGVEDPSKGSTAQAKVDARKARSAERVSGQVEAPAEAPAVVEAAKVSDILGGPGKWRENGWNSDNYYVREPGMGYPALGSKATEEDKRALYVLDSLANVAADKLVRNKVNMDRWPGMSAFRHRGTNYDAVGRIFGEDVKANAATGNLPAAPMFDYRTAISSAGNRLPGQLDAILKMDGEKSMYDKLLRAKVDRKLHEMDPRYRPSSIFGY